MALFWPLLVVAIASAAPGGGQGTLRQPILDGRPAAPGAWPDAAALVLGAGYVECGGALIDQDLVLTAKHCVEARDVRSVALSTVDLRAPGALIDVAAVWAAPEPWDIAVLTLASPAPVAARPMADPTCDPIELGATVIAVGFGARDPEATLFEPVLMEAELEVVDDRCADLAGGCEASISPGGELIAAGAGDTCRGDSGGPLYAVSRTGATILAGVTSRGLRGRAQPCGDGGVYVRAAAVAEVIEAAFERDLPSGCEDPAPSAGCTSGRVHRSASWRLWAVLAALWWARRRRARLGG